MTFFTVLNFPLNPIHWVRRHLDAIEINNPTIALWICKLIPSQCPFNRKVRCFGYTLFQIPPLCNLNPLYKQFVELRLKALACLYQAESSQINH